MNSVHEQCPISDSETVLSPKTGWVNQVHSPLAQPAHPGAHRRAQVRAHGRVVGYCGRGPQPCRSAQAALSWPCAARANAVSWPCLAVSRHIACSLAPSWSRYSPCIVTQSLLLPCSHVTNCIVTRPASQVSPQSRYNSLYRDSVSQPLSLPIAIQFSATTRPPYIAIHLGVLQYSSSACLALSLNHNTLQCIAIQLLNNPTAHVAIKYQPMHTQATMSRYNFPLYRGTVLGSSPINSSNFFFRFSLFFFTH